MAQYHAKTCVRFVPRTSENDYLLIKSGKSGCWSSVGRTGGKQDLNLQPEGCLYKVGTAIHELMHALGMFHEQNRSDRDNHVRIRFENIQRGNNLIFQIIRQKKLRYIFSKVSKPTLKKQAQLQRHPLVYRMIMVVLCTIHQQHFLQMESQQLLLW